MPTDMDDDQPGAERLNPLSQEELDKMRAAHFDPRIIQPDKAVQRLIISLDLAVAQRASLVEIMQRTAPAQGRLRLEAEVLFLVGSLCQDLMLGPAEDQASAINLMARAITEVALSRAGKLDLDLLRWTETVGLAEQNKPVIQAIIRANGLGQLAEPPPLGPDMTFAPGAMEGWNTCSACGGIGRGKFVNNSFIALPDGHTQCPRCGGRGAHPPGPGDKAMTVTMICSCARCGKNHRSLKVRKFTRPMVVPTGRTTETTYRYWGMCPSTRQPILILILEKL